MNRLLLFFLLLVGIPTIATSQALPDEVRISYACNNKPLVIVIEEISKRAGVPIVFSSKRISTRRKVTFNPRSNETLGTILTVILSRYKLRYEIVGDQIVIKRDIKSRPLKDAIISGYITDKETGEPLIGANIYTTDKTKGTITNVNGFYSLKFKPSTYRLQFSYVGYKIEREQFYFGKDTVLSLELMPQVLLNDVLITDSNTLPEEETSSSEESISLDELNSITSLGGESDIMRTIGFLPGVSSGPDGLGGINIRGGSSDQNLILLDGVPVYNAGHSLGIYSIFNSDIVKSAKIVKGSFPSRYGGRLSSVIDIRTKEGNTKKVSGAVSVSMITSKGYVEGPIGKNGSSFLFSARRTFVDPWMKELTKYLNEQNENEGFANYYFYDLNGKVNFKLGSKTNIMLGSFVGKDDFTNDVLSKRTNEDFSTEQRDRLNWDWGNKVFYLRANNQLGNKAFGNFTAHYSDYDFGSFEYDRSSRTDSLGNFFEYRADLFSSGIKDIGAKYDLDYMLNGANWIKTGVGFINHTFNPELLQASNKDDISSAELDPSIDEFENLIQAADITGQEMYGYIEDEITLGPGIKFNTGFHTSLIKTESKTKFYLQPRLAAVIQSNNLAFKAGASKMVQYLHLLSSNGLGLPNDVWLPSTDILPPEESWIYNAGISLSTSSGMKMGVEGYYKNYQKVISYDEGGVSSISSESDWQPTIPSGDGTAYGIEVSLNKRAGRTTWFSNYTFSQSNRQFVSLNNGNEFPFRYDRRHNFKLAFVHRITKNAEFALNYNASSGSPVTSPSQFRVSSTPDGEETIILIYPEKNNELLPDYQRLDVAFSFFSEYSWGRQKFTIGVYNLLNKKNPFYEDIVIDPTNPNLYLKERFSVLPILPSVSYSIAF